MNTKKRLISYLLVLILVLSMLPLSGCGKRDFTDVLADSKKGVVQLYGRAEYYNFLGQKKLAAWTGSGFGVGDAGKDTNVFVTNNHVITYSSNFDPSETEIWILLENCTIDSQGYPDRTRSIKCEVLKTSSGYPDYAIIRATTDIEGFKALPLLSSKEVEDGTTVYALGYPGEIDDISTTSYGINDITSTNGMISQHMQFTLADDTWVLLHTAQIAHGNSGGPLIDENGAVVGINTYGTSIDSDRYMAVYIDYAMDALDDLNIKYDVYQPSLIDGDALPYVLIGVALVGVIVVIVLLMLKKQKEEEARRAEEARRQAEEARRREEERRRAEERRRQEEVRRRQDAIKERAHLRCWDGHIAAVGAGATIGRDANCTIRLPDNSAGVSRTHCRVEMQGNQLVVIDLGSSYGTLIHGQRIPAHTPVALKVGSTFYLGSDKFRFTVC